MPSIIPSITAVTLSAAAWRLCVPNYRGVTLYYTFIAFNTYVHPVCGVLGVYYSSRQERDAYVNGLVGRTFAGWDGGGVQHRHQALATGELMLANGGGEGG